MLLIYNSINWVREPADYALLFSNYFAPRGVQYRQFRTLDQLTQ